MARDHRSTAPHSKTSLDSNSSALTRTDSSESRWGRVSLWMLLAQQKLLFFSTFTWNHRIFSIFLTVVFSHEEQLRCLFPQLGIFWLIDEIMCSIINLFIKQFFHCGEVHHSNIKFMLFSTRLLTSFRAHSQFGKVNPKYRYECLRLHRLRFPETTFRCFCRGCSYWTALVVLVEELWDSLRSLLVPLPALCLYECVFSRFEIKACLMKLINLCFI